MRVRRGWSPVRMTLAGLVMVLIGAPLGVWVSTQSSSGSDPTPAPSVAAVAAAVGSGPLDPDEPVETGTTRSLLAVDPTGTPARAVRTPTATPAASPRATATRRSAASPTATAPPAPTATLAPTAVPTATPEPPFDASTDPECTVAAEDVVVGQTLTLSCAGFVPGSPVRVYWKGVSRALATFEPSAGGRGEVEVTVPDAEPGRWHLRASDGDERESTARLTVVGPEMTTDAIVGERDSPFTVALRGFHSGEQVALRWYGVEGPKYSTLRTPTVAADGSASVELEVPGNSATGRHRFVAAGLSSGAEIERIFTVVAPGEALNFFQGATGCNRIALIFNVGIGNPIDLGVLDTLNREGVPATVFVMGWWVERFPESFAQIVDGGFVVGNHGYDALNLVELGDDAVRADLQTADAAIAAAMGRPPERWFTPYAGTIDDRVRAVITAEGYVPVGWRVNTDDWNAATTADAVYAATVDGAYDGAIVEYHLDGPTTASSTGVALPRIIETLRERGYTFVTVPELAAPCPAPDAAEDDETGGARTDVARADALLPPPGQGVSGRDRGRRRA